MDTLHWTLPCTYCGFWASIPGVGVGVGVGSTKFSSSSYLRSDTLVHRPNRAIRVNGRRLQQLVWSSSGGSSNHGHVRALSGSGSGAGAEEGEIMLEQGSKEWLDLRMRRLTCSSFSSALGFWPKRRVALWQEKVYEKPLLIPNAAMSWGSSNEDCALQRYTQITGYHVQKFGHKLYPQEPTWLGASPDGLINFNANGNANANGNGILEVKCPYNRGKPNSGLPWKCVPYYYMPQIQGLMEIFDRDWLHLYCWTPNASSIFRIERDSAYWASMYELLREFWWYHVVPAKQALLVDHDETQALAFKPSPTHKYTKQIIAHSNAVANKAFLLCTQVGARIDFLEKPQITI